mmetsp:Transcript_13280/g.25155  ORF Transcript_13280/g.25155 Transcript_13280/m.25155 type:complete len:246 (-) Transcript_13280:2065-2802(-)
MAKGAISPNFLALAVDHTLLPFPFIISAIIPDHFTHTVKVSVFKVSFVLGIIRKDHVALTMLETITKIAKVRATVGKSHFTPRHLPVFVNSIKHAAVAPYHGSLTVFEIVLETAIVMTAVAIGQFALAGPVTVHPIAFVPPTTFEEFKATKAMGHTRFIGNTAGIQSVIAVRVHDTNGCDMIDIGHGLHGSRRWTLLMGSSPACPTLLLLLLARSGSTRGRCNTISTTAGDPYRETLSGIIHAHH